MAEPTIPTAAAVAAAGAVTPALVAVIGVSLGLQPGDLIAGLVGAAAAILFFNAVPSTGDTWFEFRRTTIKRVVFALISASFAAYVAPVAGPIVTASLAKVLTLPNMDVPLQRLAAAVAAACLQTFLQAIKNRGARVIEGAQA